ncbi:MAG: type IX secretion system membrane protein PorP/SprF [Sphingobacteriaceae bacterium]|nr:MAG: type IX secretion system membrane protein PorP/SprF [Sphingobacteriaceae bacterium]
MKKVTTTYFFILMLLIGSVRAQQRPAYTQYILNNYLLNPALTGIENYTDVKLGHRRQWTGIEGAPTTSYFTIHAPISAGFLDGDATGLPPGGATNPMSRLYTQNYEAAAPHHGIGMMVVHDVSGPTSQTNITASYAYHLGLAPKVNLAVGVAGGMAYSSLNSSMLSFESDFDPYLNTGTFSKWNPDLSLGVWGYSSNWYVGASIQQILPQTLYFHNEASQSKTVPHYFVTGGIKVFLTEDVTLLPSALLKITQPASPTYDINAKLAFRDRLWIGGSYHKNDSFGAMLGININSLFNVGYSYDYTTSPLRTVSNGTHEIVLGILLNNRYKLLNPQIAF